MPYTLDKLGQSFQNSIGVATFHTFYVMQQSRLDLDVDKLESSEDY